MKLKDLIPKKKFISEFDDFYKRFKKEFTIYEGLIFSSSIEQLVKHLKVSIHFEFRFEINKQRNILIVQLHKPNIKDIEKLFKECDVLGWYPATLETKDYGGKYDKDKILFSGFNYISFKAKFNQEQDKIKFPEYLYHVTEKSKLSKIKNSGLSPRSNNKKSLHPERVHLFKDPSQTDEIASQLGSHTKTQDLVLLKIKVSRIPDYLRLFIDPDYDGYYTMNNIPPSAIVDSNDI